MTGVNVLFAELVAKRLGLLHDLVPKAVRVAVLVNPTNTANAEATLREIPEAARGRGLHFQVINASTSREIDAAFATVVRERADALFVAPDITGPITEGRVLINAGGPDVRFRRSCPAPKHIAQQHPPNACLSWVSQCRQSPARHRRRQRAYRLG